MEASAGATLPPPEPLAKATVVDGNAVEPSEAVSAEAPFCATVAGLADSVSWSWLAALTAPDTADQRTVIEVYEISNDTTLTRVARGADGTTWSAPLPPGITRITGGDGDVSPDAIRAAGGRAEISAPLAPGLKRVSFFYEVPADGTPVDILVESAVPVLDQLLVAEPEHAGACFVRGRVYLEADDSRGVELLERALKTDLTLVPAGCQLLYGFYSRTGQRDQVKEIEKSIDAHHELEQRLARVRGER